MTQEEKTRAAIKKAKDYHQHLLDESYNDYYAEELEHTS